VNGKHDHQHGKHDHGKHLGADLSAGGGTVSVTLDAGTAKDLLQALTLALGGGGGKGTSAALVGGKKPGVGSKGPGGKGYGVGKSKG
jgi:hypothetical protein